MVSWNGMQLVNSATHMIGERKYDVAGSLNCEAHNIWWLWRAAARREQPQRPPRLGALRAPSFEWWEIAPIYYLLKVLESSASCGTSVSCARRPCALERM